ncbi:Glucoamylase (glucan-1,4-alpha-glucosidase), GH15 family [Sulfitobacter brevis]|uniref:Glucoamylase (Glucan-1,4-alpha-glucosidase), GH15 family n=1 Tax=Sulfitobacter brevis TaxID=74348 RepID=A0A1I1WSB0_9RHOB|nr:glycoside hydrolase family 15 protein [Sulfitobacter brevis]SFD98075.1 Glucoamylase (glucan-1,4-alpha-glucosidase), GH15 family [Sulfitobacter brevis]
MDLGIIGNCAVSALIDPAGVINWYCLPRFDGDPVFHGLLGHGTGRPDDGTFKVELDGCHTTEQSYLPNTATLRTVLRGASGAVEIIDFCPRFEARGRSFRPQMLIRQVRPLEGAPRVRLCIRPGFEWGTVRPEITRGSSHVRFIGPDQVIRLTTDAPLDHVLDERLINLDQEISFVLGPDETLSDSPQHIARDFCDQTTRYWRRWVQRLAIPLEWQEAVIRAAITLKLCSYEPTGGIIAAMTTSLPEAPNSTRNWDYRYCWVRDALFTVRALNSLAATRTLENYFQWLMNLVADAKGGHIQPVLGVGLETELTECFAEGLQGYRGMGPVRVGNQAFEHFQHDTYGNIILGAAPAFFDERLFMNTGQAAFEHLEALGEQAWLLHDQPDAGLWELRSRSRIHTSSSLMCWAACDRLGKIAAHLRLAPRARHWEERAAVIRAKILERAWSEDRQSFVESFEGNTLDASVLLMGEVGFLPPDDPRFVATVEALSATLGRGPFMLRYEEADDFGVPEVGFNLCAFWRVDALTRIGRKDEARELFEALLAARSPLGLMSEDTSFATGEAWGNFPQTYSMAGIINGAMRLSRSWEAEL